MKLKLCSVIFVFGFLSSGNGYFKVPGMKTIDSPLNHLLRKGPQHLDDNWQSHAPPMNNFYAWKTPQTFSFYHKPDMQGQYFGMDQQIFPSSKMIELNRYSSGGYAGDFSPASYHVGGVPSSEFGGSSTGLSSSEFDGSSSGLSSGELGGSSSYMMNGDRLAKLMAERAIKVSGKMQDQEEQLAYGFPESLESSGRLSDEPTNKHSGRREKAEQRVVGGRDVSEGEIPWQVSLQRKSMKSGKIFHICGGSIINREWVVTAAHCVAMALLNNYRVVAATTNLRDENRIKSLHSGDYSIHKVSDVQIHDEYDMFRFRNDIALLRVDPPFEFSSKVQSIALPSSGHHASGMAYASGWGLMQEGVRVTPSTLQTVALPIVSDTDCRRAYGDNLAETMICAGYREGGKSVCQGDSGGPLFQKQGGQEVLIGVVSWGVGCARPGKPGVYTEVAHYIGWISDITGGSGRKNHIH